MEHAWPGREQGQREGVRRQSIQLVSSGKVEGDQRVSIGETLCSE